MLAVITMQLCVGFLCLRTLKFPQILPTFSFQSVVDANSSFVQGSSSSSETPKHYGVSWKSVFKVVSLYSFLTSSICLRSPLETLFHHFCHPLLAHAHLSRRHVWMWRTGAIVCDDPFFVFKNKQTPSACCILFLSRK